MKYCCPDGSIIARESGFVNEFLCKNTKIGINNEKLLVLLYLSPRILQSVL